MSGVTSSAFGEPNIDKHFSTRVILDEDVAYTLSFEFKGSKIEINVPAKKELSEDEKCFLDKEGGLLFKTTYTETSGFNLVTKIDDNIKTKKGRK